MMFKLEVLSEFDPFKDLLSYAELSGGRPFTEPFAEHALRAYNHWRLLKKRVLTSLSRILQQSGEKVDLAISLAVLLHDSGKLTTLYQDYLNQRLKGKADAIGFRHEAISTYILLNCLSQVNFNMKFNQLIAGAVLFHHEAITQQKLRKRVDVIIGPLHNKYPSGIILFTPKIIELLNKLTNTTLQLNIKFNEKILINNMRSNFVTMFQFFDPDNPVDLHVRRLRVAAVHQIISVCDNRAAYEVRPHKDYPFIREVIDGGWKY